MPAPRKSITGDETNWIEMQKSVFTNWVNQNLKQRDMRVNDLEEDFADGIKLVNLYEIVSKRKLGKTHKNPKMQTQMLENVTLVLKEMEKDGINLVSIGSDHIVNGNLKLILGLIWRMILRFQIGAEDSGVKIAVKKVLLLWLKNVIPDQKITNLTKNWNSGIPLCALVEALEPGTCPQYISLNRYEGVENCRLGLDLAERKFGIPQVISATHMADPDVDELSMMTYLSYFTQDNGIGEKHTEEWLNNWIPELKVKNFNTDWNDGIKLCTVVDKCCPGTIPELESLNPDNKVENLKLGIDTAENKLAVPKLIKPEEMANPEVPEIAVMAYILQFKTAKIPEPEPVIIVPVKSIPKPEPEPVPVPVANDFIISGSGLTEPKINFMNEFYIRCQLDFEFEKLNVDVSGPRDQEGKFNSRPLQIDKVNNQLVTCRYRLEGPGAYLVSIMYDDKHVPRSPVTIDIVQDLTKVTVSGSGLGEVLRNETAELIIDMGAENALVEAHAVSPTGDIYSATVTENANGTYTIRYMPKIAGLHGVYVKINGEDLPGCPFVAKVIDPDSVVVTSSQQSEGPVPCDIVYAREGTVILGKQLYVGPHERVALKIDATRSGPGGLSASTIGPRNQSIQTDVIENAIGAYSVCFVPPECGEYKTDVFWNSRKVQGSPFVIWVSDPSKCVAHGEGLYQARLNEAAHFEISTIDAGPGKIDTYAESDGGRLPVELVKTDENIYRARYYPDSLSRLQIFVYYNDTPLRGSPFAVSVGNPSKCKVKLDTSRPVMAESDYTLVVTFEPEAGQGDLNCVVNGPEGEVPSQISETGPDSKEVKFLPTKGGMYEVNIYYAGALLAGCPYMIDIASEEPVDPGKVFATGQGLQQASVNEPSRVHIDARRAGRAKLTATAQSLKEEVPVKIEDNLDGTYDLMYIPPVSGAYLLNVKWDDHHIPGSPFKITAYSKTDPSQVVVEGVGIKEGTAGQPVLFKLDGRKAGPGRLSCKCKAPSGKTTAVRILDNADGTYNIDLNAKEPGTHTVELDWDGQPVPGSPFAVKISQSPDVGKVKCYGPGLKNGVLGEYEGKFTVNTKGAGPGTLKIRIHGPKGSFKVQMFRESPKDRTIGVRYNPTDIGQYTINVLWSEEQAEGSPYDIFVCENSEQLKRFEELKRRGDFPVSNGYHDQQL